MDSEEREIYFYLREQRDRFVPAVAICRQAGGKQKGRIMPDWAKPVLLRMVERGILEMDAANAYRLKPIPETLGAKKWISPQIASILKRSGKSFNGVADNRDGEEAYYDNL